MSSPLPATLTTDRLQLGAWHDDDVVPYGAMVLERDPRAASAPRGAGPDDAELRRRVEVRQRAPADTGYLLYAVRRDGAFLGYCGLVDAHPGVVDAPELAYEFLRAHHGHGYATEAATAVVGAATASGRPRLWASVRPWNAASFRVLDKLGFRRSGRVTTDAYGESVWCVRDA